MTDPKELKVISTAEVEKHRDKGNGVWIIIHNDIYDVTSFLEEHPGGEDSLMDVAGQEATQDFEDVGHSDDARELMKKYLIGTLPPEEKTKLENTNKAEGTLRPSDKFNIPPCCPHLPRSTEKTWRTYDGSPSSRSLAPVKSDYKPPTTPRTEGRVNAIYVPRERLTLNFELIVFTLPCIGSPTTSNESQGAAGFRRPKTEPCGSPCKRPLSSSGSLSFEKEEVLHYETRVGNRKREEPPPPRSNLKWAVLALASAVVLGFVLKKYLSK